jgi:phosphatidylglycerophosphatase A
MKLSALNRGNFFEDIAWLLGTWFGSGCSSKAPGTIGSLCSLPLLLYGIYGGVFSLLSVTIILFFIGWWATHMILRTQSSQDPGFVVIDETVGQALTFVFVANMHFSWWMVILGFALFRFFDIVKIWPASYFDSSVHNAFGVMMDDIVAGLFAGIILYGLMFFIDAISVILQVLYFKITKGKRLFKMAPFHHHLEKCGWSENKIVLIFSLINAVFCSITFFLL